MNTCTPSLQRFEKVNFRRRKKTLPGPSFATKGDDMGGKHRSYPRTIESMLLWVAKCRGTLDEWTKRPWGQSASRSRNKSVMKKNMTVPVGINVPTVQRIVRNTMHGIGSKRARSLIARRVSNLTRHQKDADSSAYRAPHMAPRALS